MRSLKRILLLAVLPGLVLGCSGKDDAEKPAPHTGNEVFEQETVPEAKDVSRHLEIEKKTYYVSTGRLNVRSTPEVNDNNLLGGLGLNDEILILAEVAGTVFVQIQILKTNEDIGVAQAYYVSKDYLSLNKNEELAQSPRTRYFMIQNVATEKLRVYEKICDDGNCSHKMVLETDIAVGEKSKNASTMTVLGSFNVTKWYKFYQDGGGLYPSWYDPNYPPVPKPKAGVTAWTSKKVLPYKGATVRGAFGWYTAHVGPNSHNQWTHGTLGWGADKKKYIDATRGFWANLFTDPRSHGCTRTDNESIAFIRELVDVGTPVLKVYAIEALAEPKLSLYPEPTRDWDYILTKNGVRTDGEKADRGGVLARGTSSSQWLEEGVYSAVVRPSAEAFKSGKKGAKSGRNGNVYGLDKSEMTGVLLVDQGLLVNYAHPSRLDVGGYGRNSFPGFIVAKGSPAFVLP